ncbi:hypothetical protein ACNJYA_30660 [Bradyrhizobium sp. DASA03068]|uniref:hypothetical protein n=1 Tax=Bradyrhizobium sp. BLXBL-01 TaxID=3395915 RepID=UPI003F72562A
MARSKRPNRDDPTQICLAIDTRTYTTVRILGNANGYTLGAASYGNQHGHPLEAEIKLIHSYLTEVTCFPIGFLNTPLMNEAEAALKAKAAKMEEAALARE